MKGCALEIRCCSCSASKNRIAKSTLATFLLAGRALAKCMDSRRENGETRVLYRVSKEDRRYHDVVVIAVRAISFLRGLKKGCAELCSFAFEIRCRRHLPRLPTGVLPLPVFEKDSSLAKYVAKRHFVLCATKRCYMVE